MKRCFVIGPIGNKMATLGSPARTTYEDALTIYEDVIRPACEANDLEAIRADGIAVPGEITEQIFRHLYEDDVVIADVSGGNPNVMYELGLRHTRDLLTVQIGEYGQLPFDVNTLRTIMFSRSERGLIDARNQLETVLRAGLAEGSDPMPATRLWLNRERGDASLGSVDDTMSTSPDSEDQSSGNADSEEEQQGLVERMVAMEEAFPKLTAVSGQIVEVLEQLGSDAEDMGAEMETLNSSGAPAAKRLVIINRYAHSLAEPAQLLSDNTAEFANLMTDLDSSVRGIMQGFMEEASQLTEDQLEFIDSVVEVAYSTREGMEGLSEFGTTVGALGRLSKALREPGRKMEQAVRTMATAAGLVDDWEALALRVKYRLGATPAVAEIP